MFRLTYNRLIRFRRFSTKPYAKSQPHRSYGVDTLRRTTVFSIRAAVDTRDREAILSGIKRAYSEVQQILARRFVRRELPSSCAIIPPILTPITCKSLLDFHPTKSISSKASFAISDVEYRMIGLSDLPMPLLSQMRHVYLEAWS